MVIKYSEVFTSFQGEAGFAGTPTIWVRFFGCNLECNGFGQKDPTNPESYVLPYKDVDVKLYKRLEDLPVFDHGCDSSYSWSKNFDSLVHKKSVEDLVDDMIRLGVENFGLEYSEDNRDFWHHPVTNQLVQVCFTGGEPMLWQKQMVAICERFKQLGVPIEQITIETNGTKLIKDFNALATGAKVFLSVSPKLFTVSGEKNAVDYDVIDDYSDEFPGWLKFVVNGTKDCWDELDAHVRYLKENNLLSRDWDIWVMPVGATKEQQEGKTIADISIEAMRRGFKVATRNHAYVFGNLIGK